MTQEGVKEMLEDNEEGRPTTSNFRSRRFLRSRHKSREAFAATMHRFGVADNTDPEEKDSTRIKEGWLKSSITNRKSTAPITLDMLFGDNFRAVGGFNNDGENPSFLRNPDEFSAKDKIYEEENEVASTTQKESISQANDKDNESRILESDNEDDISIKRKSFQYQNKLDPVSKNVIDFDKNYQVDKAFKKKPPVFEATKPNRTVKDQGRNIFFSTHINMKVPMQKGKLLKALYITLNFFIKIYISF